MKKLQDMNPAERRKRIAELVKNPGTRSKVDAKYLPAQYRKQRDLNTRLNSPVVEGSAVTVRELSKQRQGASALKYGGAETDLARGLAAAQQQQRDTGGWYDQYKAELAQHQANIAGIGAQENAQLQQFGGAVQGLDQSQLNATTQASVADAAARGTVPGADAAVQMNQGAAVRQALLGSMGSMMAAQAGGANRYADTLSHVVAPGQKLQGMATAQGRVRQAGQKQTDLLKEKGAFEQQFEDEFRQNESKNVLAQKIATGKTAQEDKKIKIAQDLATSTVADRTAKTQETAKARRSRERIAADRTSLSDSQFQAKYGETKRHNKAMEANAAKKKAEKPGDPATVDAKDFYAKYKVKPATTVQLNSAKTDVQRAATWINDLGGPTNENGRLLTNGQAAGKNPDGTPRPAVPKMNPLFVRVAMDIKQYGGVTPGTANRLHRAGYSVAKLGLKPGKPKPKPPRTTRPGAGLVPGVGGT